MFIIISWSPPDVESEDDFEVFKLSWNNFESLIEKKKLRTADGVLLESLGQVKRAVKLAYNSSMASEVPNLRSWRALDSDINVDSGSFQRTTKNILEKALFALSLKSNQNFSINIA